MKCLVVGAEGFVGAELCAELLRRGHEVVALELRQNVQRLMPILDRIELRFGDCSDTALMRALATDFAIEAIYYGPFYRPSLKPDRQKAELRVMGEGALNCFNLVRETNVRRVVFPSSTAVHGTQANRTPLNESSPVTPFMTYGAIKLLCEYFARDVNKAVGHNAAISMRLPSIYGPGATVASRGVNIFPVTAARGEKGKVDYTADTHVCIAHVVDTAKALATAIEIDVCPHDLYELGGLDVSFGDIAEAVKYRIPDADLHFGKQTKNPLPYAIDNMRAQTELGIKHMDAQAGMDTIISYERSVEESGR